MWWFIRCFLFLLDAEDAHTLAKWGMKLMARFLPVNPDVKNSPVGLAAGFDKNAELLDILPKFGFSSAEIGTVTPLPQGGNERPRLFRNPRDQTLFNRMGFNNLGAGIISERVRKAKPKLPPGFKIGVNLGKNRSTPDEMAHIDYAKAASPFADCADYFVINVSSPNTPGLRSLQTPESLGRIVKEVKEVLAGSGTKPPIYVKLAPEVTGDDLKHLISSLETCGVSGFVLTNTIGGDYIYRQKPLTGGWSGQILSGIAKDRLVEARSLTSLPIISVGGIMTVKDALERLKLGATSIQIYTGWIYSGPFFAKRIHREYRQ